MLINEKTWDFIRHHADDDVRKLALQGVKDAEVDLQQALQQIAGRQTARRKLPSWTAVEGIIYPPHLNMEQCSSEQTARYKAKIVNGKSVNGKSVNGQSVNGQSVNGKSVNGQSVNGQSVNGKSVNGKFTDLTGGFGVDFYWISQGFQHRQYVEQNEELCAISSHNFRVLGLDCSACCCDAVTYLTMMPHVALIYMDPARRNEHGGRTYGIADCSPNVLELLPLLMSKADRVLLKLSPMLDWRKAVEDLKYVTEVHIVSVGNECKELLLLLDKKGAEDLRVVCVNFTKDREQLFETSYGGQPPCSGHHISPLLPLSPSHFLYEPNASIMKAGCFAEVEQRYPVQQISQNSHLFLSSVEIEDFPGRVFLILSISSMNKQELRTALKEIERANISVRNFPLSVDQLRKKLKLKDGGDVYIFATTMADGEHRLLICRKIG